MGVTVEGVAADLLNQLIHDTSLAFYCFEIIRRHHFIMSGSLVQNDKFYNSSSEACGPATPPSPTQVIMERSQQGPAPSCSSTIEFTNSPLVSDKEGHSE